MPPVDPPILDFAWAEQRWTDSSTGAEMVCLSPGSKSHFRQNYFRLNMFSHDGQFAVFCEFEGIQDGEERGAKRLWARNLLSGELHLIGEIPAPCSSWLSWIVARRTPRVFVIDSTVPEALSFLEFGLDGTKQRRIVPRTPISDRYEELFEADERFIYKAFYKEKWGLQMPMGFGEWNAMMVAQPGYQEMVRVDIETGEVEPLFSATDWFISHPNPHPMYPNLLMCCQEYAGSNEHWGQPKAKERIRVIDLGSKHWLNTGLRAAMQGAHEHWAASGKRIFSHGSPLHCIHFINCINLETGQNQWFPSPRDTGSSAHVLVEPGERFLVGDGFNFDRHNMPTEVRQKLELLAAKGDMSTMWFRNDLRRTNGGETIWKYELPMETFGDYGTYAEDPERFHADLLRYPDRTVRTTPICRFRSLCRSQMLGHRLESNAHVTADGCWVVFQSSSEDNWFEVWAARIPGAGGAP